MGTIPNEWTRLLAEKKRLLPVGALGAPVTV